MKHHGRNRRGTAVAAAVLIVCGGTLASALPAAASDDNPYSAADVLSLLQQHGIDAECANGTTAQPGLDGQSFSREAPEAHASSSEPILEEVIYTSDVRVPSTADEQLSVVSDFGDIAVSLPEPGSAKRQVVSDRVSTFPHGDGSTSVPIVRDNGFQVITLIADASAPQEYAYELELQGGRAELTATGEVLIYDASGDFVGGFDAPWARDNTGAEIPTSYSVVGDVLIQTVEHTGAGVSYPVVADPNYSSGPFTRSTVSTYSASNPGYKVSAWLSASGRVVHVAQPGVFSVQGWNVLKANHPGYVLSGGVNRPTMKQQWDCHIVGGIAEWDSWDLETGRPSNPNWGTRIGTVWPPAAICNW